MDVAGNISFVSLEFELKVFFAPYTTIYVATASIISYMDSATIGFENKIGHDCVCFIENRSNGC